MDTQVSPSCQAAAAGCPQVYLVEDNDELRFSLQWLLEGFGYQVVSCGSAEEFLATGYDPGPGALILDLCLPGMDGLELLGRLRDSRNLRVVMITAHGDAATYERAREAGVFRFLEKPFDHELLLATLRQALAPSR